MSRLDQGLFSTPFDDGAKKTLLSRLEDNKFIVCEFIDSYSDLELIDDHKATKIDYYEFVNAINDVVILFGEKYLTPLKSKIYCVHNIFDTAFYFDDVEFALQDIRYLNARAWMGLVLKDGSESRWFKKASDTFLRVIRIYDSKNELPLETDANYRDFLNLWSAEFLRCLFIRDCFAVKNQNFIIVNQLGSSNRSIESLIILFCNAIAKKGYSKFKHEIDGLFYCINEKWCKCLSEKLYWGFPSFFVFLIRFIFVREMHGFDVDIDEIINL